MTKRGGTKCKQLLYDLHKTISYRKLKDETLDRSVWRTHCGGANGYMLYHKGKVAVIRVLNKL